MWPFNKKQNSLRCGNCNSIIRDRNDKYCRKCGTSVKEARFRPDNNIPNCIYGPEPVRRTHECTQCGYTWTTFLMIDDEDFCPVCGSRASINEE